MIVLDRFDVVVVPFPFTDSPVARRRPALVVSGAGWNRDSGHVVCAMITAVQRSDWPLDAPIVKLATTGLAKPCVVRMKLFTLDAGLIIRRTGRLSGSDRTATEASLNALWQS